MDAIKFCIEFVLMLLILWLASVLVIFAGSVLLVFTPVIVLWCLIYDEDYEECSPQPD